ncbi:Holliday junction resolvase RuvX [Candidatus Microgenomates bacterium]|nr:Holliday junction resolvase RuvX [Candidatus Microgenomates bacterium]
MKVGVALATTFLSEPLEVIRYKNEEELFKRLKTIIESHNIERIVVGESQHESKQLAHEFGEKLKNIMNIEVVYSDENLTSKQAQILSFQVGIKKSKRKEMEDAYAASIMLQEYLDTVA